MAFCSPLLTFATRGIGEDGILDCPAHAEARADLIQALDSALTSCGLTREHDGASRNWLISLLLGSPHPHLHERPFNHPATRIGILLRAAARFIKSARDAQCD